jgi:hypothetical protein
MPDFFRERHERQALAGHYAALRILQPSDSVTTSANEFNISGSVVNSGCHSHACIEEWVQELENNADEETDAETDADVDESGSVGGESQEEIEWDTSDSINDDKCDQDLSRYAWHSEAVDICSTSMDYEESSIRPDVIQYRVCDLLYVFQIFNHTEQYE